MPAPAAHAAASRRRPEIDLACNLITLPARIVAGASGAGASRVQLDNGHAFNMSLISPVDFDLLPGLRVTLQLAHDELGGWRLRRASGHDLDRC